VRGAERRGDFVTKRSARGDVSDSSRFVTIRKGDFGRQNVRFARKLFVAALARRHDGDGCKLASSTTGGSGNQRIQNRNLGTIERRLRDLPCVQNFRLRARNDTVFESDPRREPMAFAELVAVGRKRGGSERRANFAFGFERSAASDVNLSAGERELGHARGWEPGAERMTTESERLLRLLDQADPKPQMNQVRDIAREAQAVAEAAVGRERSLEQLERASIVVTLDGQNREVRKREPDGALLAARFRLGENAFEDRPRFVPAAAGEERNRAIDASAQAAGQIAATQGFALVLCEV
jgi:hypothetical protein